MIDVALSVNTYDGGPAAYVVGRRSGQLVATGPEAIGTPDALAFDASQGAWVPGAWAQGLGASEAQRLIESGALNQPLRLDGNVLRPASLVQGSVGGLPTWAWAAIALFLLASS